MKLINFLLGITVAVFLGCSQKKEQVAGQLSGTIAIDGSSTVFPITEAMAEEFQKIHPGVRVTIGVSGTGGGFKKFSAGEIAMANASRTIKDSEAKKSAENSIKYLEIPVAYDGITIVINPQNTWATDMTVEELNLLWKPESNVEKWSQIREGWPERNIKLYGPGTDSGTFDYFTEAINGKSQASRSTFTKSEDDNVLVQGVAGDVDALGYFGFSYYLENKDKVKAVAIQGGKGAVTPSIETINNGTYSPLSRPVFIYVNLKEAQRPEVQEFIRFYLNNAPQLVQSIGYVPMPQEKYAEVMAKFEEFLQQK